MCKYSIYNYILHLIKFKANYLKQLKSALQLIKNRHARFHADMTVRQC